MNPEEELNKKYDIHKVVDQAVRGAMEYDKSSRQSAIELAVLKTNFKDYMEENKKEHADLKDGIKNGKDETLKAIADLQATVQSALDKKAGVWVEKVLIWLGIIIGGGVLAYLGSIIIRIIESQ